MESKENDEQRNIDSKRYRFRSMYQRKSLRESFVSYVERLKEYLKDCKFLDPDSQLRDHLLYNSRELRLRAFNSNMSLDAIISMGEFIDTRCTRCGSPDHKYLSKLCQALSVTCKYCSRRGHYSSYCKFQKASCVFESEDKNKTLSEESAQKSQDKSQQKLKNNEIELRTRPSSKNRKRISEEFESSSSCKKPKLSVTSGKTESSCKKPILSVISEKPEAHQKSEENLVKSYKKQVTKEKQEEERVKYHFGSIGGMPVKIFISKLYPTNVVSDTVFKDLREKKHSIFTMDNLPLKIGPLEYDGQFTSYIELNQKSKYASFLIKKGLNEAVIISEKIAQSFGLILK